MGGGARFWARAAQEMFQESGAELAQIVTDDSGRSRGYGTVKFATKEAAAAAMEQARAGPRAPHVGGPTAPLHSRSKC